jgi:RND family efflux transporter MFP subunit
VVAASVAVVLFVRSGSPDISSDDVSDHQHASATGQGELSPVEMDDDLARRVGVTFATAELRPLERTLRSVGMVAYDETRLADVSPKISGWVEKLHVDFTGAVVLEGQPLLDVYSPLLVSAQEELLLARRLTDETEPEAGSRAAIRARELLESARRRLGYWDIPQDEIARIESSGSVIRAITLRAPASGIVVEKNVVLGASLTPGMKLYRIADLSRVWIEAEIFEKDLSLIQMGQHAAVTFEAYPGEVFSAVVTYVYPTVSMEARTGRIRLELANADLRLKPGMYAEAEFSLPAPANSLVIPRSAILTTGERSVVFVAEHGMLMPRDVVTGLLSGNEIEILSGLSAEEIVVSSASFLIDAESNLGSAMEAMGQMDAEGAETSQPDTAAEER